MLRVESALCPVEDCSGTITWHGDLYDERPGDCSDTFLHPHRWNAANGMWRFAHDRMGEAREAASACRGQRLT